MGATIVQLSNGQTALLRDVSQVSERLRRPVKAAQMRLAAAAGIGGDEGDTEATAAAVAALVSSDGIAAMDALNDALVVALVESWTVTGTDGQPLPITAETLLDIPGDDYDTLRAAVAPLMDKVGLNFGPTTKADDLGGVSPSEPSAG